MNTPWVQYDPDEDGLPNLEHLESRQAWAAGVQPRVPSGQISPGDTYNVKFTISAGTINVPTSLSSYFVTTPAIARWAAGGEPVEVDYPVADGAEGSAGNPIESSDGRLTLTFWRPQRLAITPTEAAAGRLVDMGNLRYGLSVSVQGQEGTELGCGGHYQDLSDSLADTYEPDPDPETDRVARLFSLRDGAADAIPDPDNTLSLTVDLAACLQSAGIEETAGATLSVSLTAAGESREGGMDRAAQTFMVQLAG